MSDFTAGDKGNIICYMPNSDLSLKVACAAKHCCTDFLRLQLSGLQEQLETAVKAAAAQDAALNKELSSKVETLKAVVRLTLADLYDQLEIHSPNLRLHAAL